MKKQADAALHWPPPPFHALAAGSSAERRRDAIVLLFDDRAIGGRLLQFDTASGTVLVQPPDSWDKQRIEFKDIRTIKLTGSVALQPDVDAIKANGEAARQAIEIKPFRAFYKDGGTFSGDTLGTIQEAFGWFLFLVKEGNAFPTQCFIPAQALARIEFSPRGGGEPPRTDAEAADGASAAPEIQWESPSREPSADAPASAPMVASVVELERALAEQQSRPAQRIGDMLVGIGAITKPQLQYALMVQTQNRGRHLGGILLDMGIISRQQLRQAVTDQLGIPKVNVRDFKIAPDAIALIDAGFAQEKQVLPLHRTDSALIVALESPWDTELASSLRFSTGLSIVPVVAVPQDLKARIVKEYRESGYQSLPFDSSAGLVSADLTDLTFQLSREIAKPAEQESDTESAELVSDSALVKLLNKIVQDACQQGASDIHFESNPGKATMRIRFRIDGVLVEYTDLSSAYRNALISRIKIMAGLNIAERRLAQDGKIDFAAQGGGIAVELRVATIPTANNLEDAVLRILARAEPIPIDRLSLSGNNLAELKKIAGRSHGLILVCGPTGSGKTTTLHALLGHLNRPDVKIWTAEDPIEITQPGLRQVQVHNKIGWNFATIMHAFLRADPDVIMMGEVRTADAAKICIEASLTGHLVFSTLHTNSAPESVTRLLDFGMDPFNLSDALLGILSQRLARRLCGKCRRAHVAPDQELTELAHEYCVGTNLEPAQVIEQWRQRFGDKGRITLHTAVGCDACIGGYKGRIGVHELMFVTPRIQKLINTRASTVDIALAAQEAGMITLRQDCIDKVLQGVLDVASAHYFFN